MTNGTTGLLRGEGVPGFSTSEEEVLSRERWGEGEGGSSGSLRTTPPDTHDHTHMHAHTN